MTMSGSRHATTKKNISSEGKPRCGASVTQKKILLNCPISSKLEVPVETTTNIHTLVFFSPKPGLLASQNPHLSWLKNPTAYLPSFNCVKGSCSAVEEFAVDRSDVTCARSKSSTNLSGEGYPVTSGYI